jgi:hypothetical protein
MGITVNYDGQHIGWVVDYYEEVIWKRGLQS